MWDIGGTLGRIRARLGALPQRALSRVSSHPSVAEIDHAYLEQVHEALQGWRQGEVVHGIPFVHVADLARPGTNSSAEATAASGDVGLEAVISSAPLVVVSQTCDVVAKHPRDAPFVNVARLVQLPKDQAHAARAGDRPRFVHVPHAGDDDDWFADLDMVTTVEKSAMLGLDHYPGVDGSTEESDFSARIARKFGRFAFPDDVHESLTKLQDRFKGRHNRENSPEAAPMQVVRQIRASADPSWDAANFDVHLHFILPPGTLVQPDDEVVEPSTALLQWYETRSRGPAEIATELAKPLPLADQAWLWDRLVEAWVAQCDAVGAVTAITAEAVSADEMRLSEYWNTERLDLDHLSVRRREPPPQSEPPQG